MEKDAVKESNCIQYTHEWFFPERVKKHKAKVNRARAEQMSSFLGSFLPEGLEGTW